MPSALTEACHLATLLHAVFSARRGEDLVAACHALVPAGDGGAQDDELEFAFNRLFVGPDVVPAPPYASVYLDAAPLLMGSATTAMRELAHSLGLATADGQPEDHLACELEIWLVLVRLLDTAPTATREDVRAALGWLTEEHLALWIPPFLKRARAATPPPTLAAVLDRLEHWSHLSLQRSLYEEK